MHSVIPAVALGWTSLCLFFFFFQAEDGIRDVAVTGVQTCALPISISPNDRIQYRLHPWTSFAIVPLFALANAGIHINGDLLGQAVRSPITLGIVVGYVVGKPLGILAGAWLASRTVTRGLRLELSWPV